MPFHSQFPLLPGLGVLFEVEIHVVGDEKIEIAVAVIVDEGAAGAPARAGDGQPGFRRDVGEFAAAPVAVQDVGPVVGDQQIGVAVVIDIAYTGGLCPAGAGEAGFAADLGKMAPAVVAIELRVSRCCAPLKDGPVGDEDIVGSVAVVIEDGGAGSGALEQVFLLVLSAERVRESQAALSRNVDKADSGGVSQEEEGKGCDCQSPQADEHLTGPDLP